MVWDLGKILLKFKTLSFLDEFHLQVKNAFEEVHISTIKF